MGLYLEVRSDEHLGWRIPGSIRRLLSNDKSSTMRTSFEKGSLRLRKTNMLCTEASKIGESTDRTERRHGISDLVYVQLTRATALDRVASCSFSGCHSDRENNNSRCHAIPKLSRLFLPWHLAFPQHCTLSPSVHVCFIDRELIDSLETDHGRNDTSNS